MSLSLLPLPLQVAHPEKQHRMVVSNLVTNQKSYLLLLQVAHPEKQHRMVVSNLVTNQKVIAAAAAGGSS
jgi:hypothetical protein